MIPGLAGAISLGGRVAFLAGGLALGGLHIMSDPYHWGRVQTPWMVWPLLTSLAARRWEAPAAIGLIALTPAAHALKRLLA